MLHLQLLLRAGQSPTVLSESEEQRFHSWPFEQQQLFCLCCQAINAGSPPHPPPAPGLEQLPAAGIRLPGRYLSQARVFSAGGVSPSSVPAAFAGAGHCSLLSIQPPLGENRRSEHTWAGLGCSCCRQQSQPGLHSIGSSSFTWQRAPCCPSSSSSSWQEPAPSSRVPWGKRGSFTAACWSRPNRPVFPV